MAGRSSVLRGNEIVLTAIFLDAGGNYADADPLSSLKVSIYPPGFDPRSGAEPEDAWVLNATLSDGGTGPYASSSNTITRTSAGKYSYSFVVPGDSDFGAGHDNWIGIVDSQNLNETFCFTVVGGGAIGTTQLFENNAVLIELKSTIAATDGSTLGQDYKWHFTTRYNPHYTSVRRIRLEVPALKDVPDDTIHLAIFEASLEADALIFGTLNPDNWKYFLFARRMYTTCLTKVILLSGIAGSGGGAKAKRLADLDINYGDDLEKRLQDAMGCMVKYEAILTSAGELGPGTSQKPSMVIKGINDPDRPVVGRGWEPTSTYSGSDSQLPASNIKSRYNWRRRSQRDYANRARWNSLWRW